MREPCANLGSRRELKIFSQVRAANHFQKSICGANQNFFHRFAPRTNIFFHRFAPYTNFKNLFVARTKNIFIGLLYKSKSSTLWSANQILSIKTLARTKNIFTLFQKCVSGANQKSSTVWSAFCKSNSKHENLPWTKNFCSSWNCKLFDYKVF